VRQLYARELQFCPLLWFPRFMREPGLRAGLAPYAAFFRDVLTGRLPPVSFLAPDMLASAHPPLPLRLSMHAADRAVRALRAANLWNDTLFVLNFDEAGGFYDHVPPPVLDEWGPGIRVPCLLLGGRVLPGVRHEIFDHTSVLRLVEEQFGLPLLGHRTSRMQSLAAAFG
jgi:phospholipase C